MQIPSEALVLIADGEKALFLRNEGDEKYPNLQVEKKRTQDNPPTREQAANRRGRMFDGTGHKSAVDDTDWHELAKDRFAADLSERLYQRAHDGDFNDLIIVATPNTLGELRQHLHSEVADKLRGEVDKNWTNHPLDEVESLLQKQ
ncbi:host attachment family protein [Parasphingorhabdus sp. JC815]|uniref:host attachment family protein n=1 Tax=Parasphingorhabdus sp. JC815 TaxID=3232140 RepID=UPI003459AA7C